VARLRQVVGVTSTTGDLLEVDDCNFSLSFESVESSFVELLLQIERRLSRLMADSTASIASGEVSPAEVVRTKPLQVSLVSRGVLFTALLEKALECDLREHCFENLALLQGECKNTSAALCVELRSSDPGQLERMKLSTNIVAEAHSADVAGTILDLARGFVGGSRGKLANDLLWQVPVRFYQREAPFASGFVAPGRHRHAHRSAGAHRVVFGRAELNYGYELISEAAPFYIAPLTYRCLLACAAAVSSASVVALGAPPGAGKSGSGKTEVAHPRVPMHADVLDEI